jgi:selenocysteine-specific elongation factor
MTVVIGTAGHIDHGKTTLLRALTGIDADRLPEEQRRGMTIDVGYAHLDLDDGTSIDFVDVPGHDALIGNMLVGTGEIDAAMLVVAADDGPRAQTLEHLELLDALGLRDGIAVVTKADVAGPGRAAEVAGSVVALLAQTSLAGAVVLVASATTGEGIDAVREALIRLRDLVLARAGGGPARPLRLSIDRAFAVRGRGVVVTGSLRGGDLRPGDALRLEPGGLGVRVRGLGVHHGAVEAAGAGRTAVNLAGAELGQLFRGAVLTSGPGILATDRLLVAIARPASPGLPAARERRPGWPPTDGARLRLHLGTAGVDATVGRRGREGVELPDGRVGAILRLTEPVATFSGDRGVLRRPSPGDVAGGIEVLDPRPAGGISRRRATPERLAVLAVAVADGEVDAAADALVGLHGALLGDRVAAVAASLARPGFGPPSSRHGLVLAPDVRTALEAAALDAVASFHRDHAVESGLPVSALRSTLRTALGRLASIRREDSEAADAAIGRVTDDLVARRRLAREGDRFRDPARDAGPPPALAAAMDRLEVLLDVPAPPDLSGAARAAGCPPEGIRALEAAGRIVRVEADLAWAAPAFRCLVATALELARRGPLAPAALRDATGTSRRVVMPFLEDLNRRGILARTPAGHVPGPRAPREPEGPPMSGPGFRLNDVTGVVLAGGRSSRFGSDKLAIDLDGRPLLHRAIEAVAAVTEHLIVVAAPGVDPPIPGDLGGRIHVVHDPEPFGGPLVGIVAALAAADTPMALVAGGDMPRMIPAVLRRLAVAIGPGRSAVTLEVPGRLQPFPMALDTRLALAAGRAVLERGGRSLHELLRELGAASVPAPVWLALDPLGATIADIDRPSDLRP